MEAICADRNVRNYRPEHTFPQKKKKITQLVTRGENGTSIAAINIPHFALPNNKRETSSRTFTLIPELQNQITCRSHRLLKAAL